MDAVIDLENDEIHLCTCVACEVFNNSRFGWITFQMERRESVCNTQPDVG